MLCFVWFNMFCAKQYSAIGPQKVLILFLESNFNSLALALISHYKDFVFDNAGSSNLTFQTNMTICIAFWEQRMFINSVHTNSIVFKIERTKLLVIVIWRCKFPNIYMLNWKIKLWLEIVIQRLLGIDFFTIIPTQIDLWWPVQWHVLNSIGIRTISLFPHLQISIMVSRPCNTCEGCKTPKCQKCEPCIRGRASRRRLHFNHTWAILAKCTVQFILSTGALKEFASGKLRLSPHLLLHIILLQPWGPAAAHRFTYS